MGILFSLINSFWEREMELALLGLNNSGKSSFCHVLDKGEFDPDQLPTIGFNLPKISKGNVSLKCWDLGGQQNFRTLWSRYARSSDAIIYVIDPADPATLDLSIEELTRILSLQELSGIPLLILFNKMDLLSHLSVEQQNEKIRDILTQLRYDELDRHKGFLPISCKALLNIDKALEWLIDISDRKAKAQN